MWPLAFADVIREGDANSIWARLHARQALVFGLAASVAFVVLLALPLFVTLIVPGISTGATIGVYTAGLIADVLALVAFAVGAIRYSLRAARGELFAIPLVTPIVDRVFRLHRS